MTDETRVPALPWPLCKIMQPPGAAAAMAAAAGGSGGRGSQGGRGGHGGQAPRVDVVEDRLVVTGAPLESVLAAVESRIGVDVELVRCERRISGGLGGFFGREQFIVEARPLGSAVAPPATVDPPDPLSAEAAPAVVPGTVDGHTFADALAAALADLDAPAVEVPDPAAAAPAVPAAADLLLALLAERADVLDLSHVDHASLDRIADLIAPASPAPAPPASTAPTDGAPLAPAAHAAPTAPAPVTAPAATVPPAAAPVAPAVVPLAPAAPTVPPVAPAGVDAVAESRTTRFPVPAVSPSGLRSGSALLAMSAPHLSFEQVVAAVGEITGAAPALPEAGIVAVVGDADDALRTAEALAASVGADPGEVLAMSPTSIEGRPSWMRIATAEDADRRRVRWMQNDRLTFVAVVLTPGPDGMNWGCLSLDALSPTQTRLAVPGWRHAEDVEHRLRCLAPVDAIDLTHPTDVATCAGFMDLDVPVGSIGGEPATHEAWAEWLRSPSPTAAAGLGGADGLPAGPALDAGRGAPVAPVAPVAPGAVDPSRRRRSVSTPTFPVVEPSTGAAPTRVPRRIDR